ncbi:DsbA family oxidoreductase [Ornithinimicrobium humiphilum]|uniref:Putative DsbA family dithiol-disulfide isomerase n=1 Tax=Ornithinimicrobium humiphilum TaxID=125288 RepID=A0A543K7U0_9MICO|nr:DsbA family oxidoreductase [Ornithinimicrobium humiphilum]TQM91151.1 putative DsbA family dithiol-disulfide isomerase [Ornithinimicrobium humiphilum]
MRIDVWSDIACPWCYIGKRRLESALASFPHADRVEVVWHSFQLDPTAPVPPVETSTSALARKYGGGPEQIAAMQDRVSSLAAAEGLDYQLERTLHLNTRDAHRLLHLALHEGGPELQGRLKEALLEAYFVRAGDVTDAALLEEIATGVGLAAEDVRRVLASDEFDAEVAADIDQARAYGASGVPFFVVDERYGISGAQPTEVFAGALERAWSERTPTLATVPGAGDADGSGVCGPDGCEVPQA